MNLFQQFFAYLRLRDAVRKADEAWLASRRRFYVLPGSGRSLLIMDRDNFRILKRKRYISHDAFISDCDRESFYFTPYADGSCPITESVRKLKVGQFFSWYDTRLRQEKKMKRQKKTCS